MRATQIHGIATVAATLLLTGTAVAEISFDAGGMIKGSGQTVVHELNEAHTVMMTEAMHDAIASADPSNPMNGSSGVCFGMMEVIKGALSGGGYCNYDDTSGERFVVKWGATSMSESGALKGDWSLIGGNGKWIGSGGGGTFSSMTDPDTGKFENSVTGEISLK